MRKILLMSLMILAAACEPSAQWNGSLDALLADQGRRFGPVMKDPEKFRVQVLYTQIDRDAGNRPTFRSYSYRVDPTEYFYPASTVKLPTAALALEKISRLNLPGLDRDTAMLTGSAAPFQTEALADDTSPTGLPSVAHYIRKILLVSDNDAFNRLYEFLGLEDLNESLRQKGFAGTRIVHRLELPLSVEENRQTNPVRFVNGTSVVHDQAAAIAERSYLGTKPELLGVAEIVDGERLGRPKDFAEKNAYPLQDLHDTIKVLMFPDSMPAERRFDLTDDDYRFLYRYMSMYPGESGIDAYGDAEEYPQGYAKFLMFGGDAETIPAGIRVFNKVGDAYGFLTDAAYVVDFRNNVEFLLAATVYTNENQTFNDNTYEYDRIGLPFLRELGQAIYEIELARPREHEPDLSRFRFPDRN